MEATRISISGDQLSKLASTASKVDSAGKTALELTVVLKDSERTYRHKFLIYEDVTMTPYDAIVQECIREARLSFKDVPEDIIIKSSLVVQ